MGLMRCADFWYGTKSVGQLYKILKEKGILEDKETCTHISLSFCVGYMGNKIIACLKRMEYSINHRLSELEQTVANYSKKNDSFVCTSLLFG